MPRIRLIHWSSTERQARAATLRAQGHTVDARPLTPATLRTLKRNPPSAVVIDLTRLPMQGRDVGIALRHSPRTRSIPLVFVGGSPEQVERVKAQLPDAAFTQWPRIRATLKRALGRRLRDPVTPPSVLAGYSGTPLPKKLGIREGATVVLAGAPRDFAARLGRLPDGVTLRRRTGTRGDLTIWFVRNRATLVGGIKRMVAHSGESGLWIAWPKQASGMASDITASDVRRAGLEHGLVDFKVAAIDGTWSGLRFARRKRG